MRRFNFWKTIVCLLGIVLCGALIYVSCKGNKTAPPNCQGIDVSHHNGRIEWERVPAVQFVYIKATEGATYQDKDYARNIDGARQNGLLVGSYHYFRTTSSVEDQFENFTSHVDKEKQDLIPMVDVEECKNWTRAEFQDSLNKFFGLVEEYYGAKPMIYSVNSFYNRYCAPKFNAYPLMIGRYGKKPPVINGAGHYTIWQYSEKGKLSGIPKPVDFDCFHSENGIDDIRMPGKVQGQDIGATATATE